LVKKTAFASIQNFQEKELYHTKQTPLSRISTRSMVQVEKQKTVNRIDQIDVCQDAYHRTMKVSESEQPGNR
jgi:hypothetical protein